MSYSKIGFVNDETEASAENFNHMEDGIEKAYGQLLLAVSNVAPEECVEGDKYFNTETNKIYTATGTDTWGTTGVDAELGVFYIVLESQNIYTYNGATLISVGGGAGGSGDSTPIGTVQAYAGSTAPNGYLLCDGSAVSRTTYKELFQVIGTTYGTGDGSTTFNLPNIKGKVVVMQDANDTDFDTLGETGGEKKHTLTIDELAGHQHNQVLVTGIPFGFNAPSGTGAFNVSVSGSAESGVNNLYTNSVGGSQPHNIVQPYIVLNYIIKVQKTEGEVLSEQLPVGTEVDFDGDASDIPIGWEEVDNVLYEDAIGTTGTVTLSKSRNNFRYIIITAEASGHSISVIVDKTANYAQIGSVYSALGINRTGFFAKLYDIGSTTITPNAYSTYVEVQINSNSGAINIERTDSLYIKKVVGYK